MQIFTLHLKMNSPLQGGCGGCLAGWQVRGWVIFVAAQLKALIFPIFLGVADITIKMQHKILSFPNCLQTRQGLAGQRVRGLDGRPLQVWTQNRLPESLPIYRKFANILYACRRGLRHGYSVELSPLARIAATARRNPEDLYRFFLATL